MAKIMKEGSAKEEKMESKAYEAKEKKMGIDKKKPAKKKGKK